jgi:predicted hydrocarbon binding protein
MAASPDVAAHTLLALPWPTVAALRAALLRAAGADAPVQLQEAGYAGGEALFDAFRSWLAGRGLGEPGSLPLQRFAELATEFFEELGWGSIAIGSMHDALATVDATRWMESDDAPGDDAPACHVSTGLFADFFSRVAEVPLAVLEVECRTTGAERCRFLVGSVELLEAVYEALGRGEDYEAVARGAGRGDTVEML